MKGIIRFIKRYSSSFLALFLLIAAGMVCFLTPRLLARDLGNTALPYYAAQARSDAEIASSLGFEKAELDTIRNLPGVAAAEGYYSSSAILSASTLVRKVTVFSLTETVDRPEAILGRLPESYHECALGEEYQSLSVKIGDQIVLYPDEEEDSLPLKTDTLTVVGIVRHPAYLRQGEANFVLIHPDLAEKEADDGIFERVLIRMGSEDGNRFSEKYEEEVASLHKTLAAYGEQYVNGTMKSLESAYLQQEAEAMADIAARQQQLDADEAALNGRSSSTESHLRELQQDYEDKKAEWEAEYAVREAIFARFSALQEDLQEKGSRLEQLQSIDKIVRGGLTQAETILNNSALRPMLTVFRSCAEGILGTFLTADLTKPSIMESAVESARTRWDTQWETFRQGLTAEEIHEIEKTTGRSMVALGLQISNQLRDYGNTLQSAGAQNSSLQEEIRTIVNEGGSGALSTAISTRITELRAEIAAQEQAYLACSEELSAEDAILQEKQDLYAAAAQMLLIADSEYEDWRAGEEARITQEKGLLEQEKAETEAVFAEKKAELALKRNGSWSLKDLREDMTVRDMSLLSRLSVRASYWSAAAAGLGILIFAVCFFARLLRREMTEVTNREILRAGFRNINGKAGLALLIFAVPAVLLGTFLGRMFGSLLSERSRTVYSFAGGQPESFWKDALLPAAAVLLILLLAIGLGIHASRGKLGSLTESIATAFAALLICFVTGGIIWMGWGLFRSGQVIAERAPVFTALTRGGLIVIALLALFWVVLVLPEQARFVTDQKRLELHLMRVNGADRSSCGKLLRKNVLLPAALGAAAGAGAGFFVFRQLLPKLQLLDADWKQLPLWLVWAPAALIAFLLVISVPSGIRRYAVLDALTDSE